MSEPYRIASFDEMESSWRNRDRRWSPVRGFFEIESFGVNSWVSDEAGQAIINEHDESGEGDGQEEVYVVTSGRATFTIDGETVEAPEGTIVFVRDPTARRTAVAEEAGTRVLVVGAKRGEAFSPSGWERSAPALEHFGREEYDKAAEVLEAMLAERPDGVTHYNLACAYSMLGRKSDAIEQLRRSVELEDRFRELARTDTDLDPIRDEPEFAALT